MNNLKRIIALVLALCSLFSLAACEEYEQIGGTGGILGGIFGDGGAGDGDGGNKDDDLNDDPTDDFTVTLTADGQPYSPRMEMQAYWNDGFSIHTATFDKNGVARVDGLDGDYRVTLSDVPNEYTYNPNGYIATNDDRNITVELYTLNHLSGGGTGVYDCYQFTKTGVYSAVLNGPDEAIYFRYAPEGNGVYSIESWMDITADNVNPYVDVYRGTFAWSEYVETINDGGPVGSYTLNFVHTVKIADENISSGGQATYTFAVKAESKNNKYPITVTFAVKRNGSFELPPSGGAASSVMATVDFDFSNYDVNDHEYGSEYSLLTPEYRHSSGALVFDEARVKLWPKSKGGDGFYHLYDEVKYAETDGYGPILYAAITSTSRFLDKSIAGIEYVDPNATDLESQNARLSCNGINYKHFIEGYTQLSTYGKINGGTYYCSTNCTCHTYDQSDPASKLGWACTDECTNCTKDCRRCPAELIGVEGYRSYANSDGMVPVTEELQEFLYNFVQHPASNFFRDGMGDLEKQGYQAPSGSEWLIMCYYYDMQ